MNEGLPTLPISRDRLRDGPVRISEDVELPAGWGPDGFTLRGPLRVEAEAEESRNGNVRLDGVLSVALTETCSRCLGEVERDREVPVDVRFEPDLDPWDEGPGLYGLAANREELDAGPALREELILALPDYPLCMADCRGLCPSCGQDLNEGECGCRREAGDPRWDALRQLEGVTDTRDEHHDEEQDG